MKVRKLALRHLACRHETRIDARQAIRFAVAPTKSRVEEYCNQCDGWFARSEFRLVKE